MSSSNERPRRASRGIGPAGTAPGAFTAEARATGVTGARTAGTSAPRTLAGASRPAPARARRVMAVVVVVLTMSVAAVWAFATLRQLSAAVLRERAGHLAHARAEFDSVRARSLDSLRVQCRVLVEDPRLKSTLATDGVDQETVADILRDLSALRRTGFLMVLSPEGKVFAEAGADELRGLDLSGSSPIKKARTSPDAVAGSWVINRKMVDLSIMAVRFGTTPVAYLVVGQAVDRELLKGVADDTGVALATVAAETVMVESSQDDLLAPVFTALARQAGSFEGRTFELDGRTYVTASSELEDTGQARPRLVMFEPLAPASAAFELVRWLILIAPGLMFVAVLFAMIANRRAAPTRS